MSRNLIALPEIARRHGRHPATIHRLVNRLGFERYRLVGESTRGQKALHIRREDYDLLKVQLDREVRPSAGHPSKSPSFYLIQTEPELDPGRFKVGFSTDVEERLRSHQTSAPLSQLIKTWPCEPRWERTAIDCITFGMEQMGAEVFRATEIQDAITRADQFFDLMPAPAPEGR